MDPRIDHVHYRASDFAESRHFYVDVMGAEDLGPLFLNGKEHLHFRLGGTTLLFAPADPASESAGNDRLGAYHIALHVEDCDAAVAYYTGRGAKLFGGKGAFDVTVDPPTPTPAYRVAFLEAPDGMTVELKQDVG